MATVAILVDECRWPYRGRLWCHLVSDTCFEELHEFARGLGIPRVAFQGDHYDLHETGRQLALAHGAQPVGSRDVVRALDRSGLRRGPALERRGLAGVLGLPAPELRTDRLVLRQWRPEDLAPMAAIEADAAVMRHLRGPRSPADTAADIDAQAVGLAVRGIGKWAVELRATGELLGRTGLGVTLDPRHRFAPAVELGARLASDHQGRGYATEAATAALAYAFDVLEVDHVVAWTARTNERSQAALERLGMVRVPEWDFEDDRVPVEDPARHQVVARLRRPH